MHLDGRHLTENWAACDLLPDGTQRCIYFDLHQDAVRITGYIRTSQFYYWIAETTGTANHFTLVGSMLDGVTTRQATYEGQVVKTGWSS